MKRGEIWMCDLGTPKGSEKGYKRPCLIVQADNATKSSPNVTICPITSCKKKFNITHVYITCLLKPSYIECEQIRTIAKERMYKYITTISTCKLKEVENKLKLHLVLGGNND